MNIEVMGSYKLYSLQKIGLRSYSALPNYVPKHSPLRQEDVTLLTEFIRSSRKILVLTGAGISTESGIPDYRSEGVGLYARTNHKPIQYQEFVNSPAARNRYWARNFVGWDRFSQMQPNTTHYAIRDLEIMHGKVTSVVTQNVDNLHTKAGSRSVIELHGSTFRVNCLQCDKTYNRFDVQESLRTSNPGLKLTSQMIRPDGDVEIPQETIDKFNPPFCNSCHGVLKPDIVFFGDNVPKQRVELVRANVSDSDSILVLGSSLTVFSSYRIILQALEEQKRVCVVNIGPTRADHKIDIRIAAKCGEILPSVLENL